MLFTTIPEIPCSDKATALQVTHQPKIHFLVGGRVQQKYYLVHVPLFFQLSQQDNSLKLQRYTKLGS